MAGNLNITTATITVGLIERLSLIQVSKVIPADFEIQPIEISWLIRLTGKQAYRLTRAQQGRKW